MKTTKRFLASFRTAIFFRFGVKTSDHVVRMRSRFKAAVMIRFRTNFADVIVTFAAVFVLPRAGRFVFLIVWLRIRDRIVDFDLLDVPNSIDIKSPFDSSGSSGSSVGSVGSVKIEGNGVAEGPGFCGSFPVGPGVSERVKLIDTIDEEVGPVDDVGARDCSPGDVGEIVEDVSGVSSSGEFSGSGISLCDGTGDSSDSVGSGGVGSDESD